MSDVAATSEWLSVEESCALLNVSRATFYRLVKRGAVPAFRLGGRLQFRRADVLAARKPVPPPSSSK